MNTKRLIEAVYLVTSALGALIIAANINANVYGYLLFLAGSVAGSYLVVESKAPKSLLYVNIMFGCINVIGLVRYWM